MEWGKRATRDGRGRETVGSNRASGASVARRSSAPSVCGLVFHPPRWPSVRPSIHPSSRPQSRTTESKVTGRKEQKFRQGLPRGGGEIDTTCCLSPSLPPTAPCAMRCQSYRRPRDVAFSQTCDRLLHMDYLLRLPPSCEGRKRPNRPDLQLHRPGHEK